MTVFLFVSPSQATPQAKARYGGTFKWGVYHKPGAINPLFTTQTASAALIQLIFNGLVRINPAGEVEPDLAQAWDISDDGLVYTFYLRKGVLFHDGIECTAEDALFFYRAMMDPKVDSPFRESFDIVDNVRATDKYTFQVSLKEPSASFIYRMVRHIVPAHILKGKDLRGSDFNVQPVGTGPFKFKEWTKEGQITLESNPDYYEGRPYLDKILVKTYADSKEVWVALMRGEVDCAEFIAEKDYEIIKKDPSFKAYAFAADGYYALVYNSEDPLLADKRIREAIAHAVDRKGMIERMEAGYGIECTGPFSQQSLGFNPDVVPYEYDPPKALQLLEEAGWKDDDKDGILEKEGAELELNVLVDERNEVYGKIVMILRQQLQEAGIRLSVRLYDDDSLLTPEFIKEKKIQAYLTFLLAGMDPDQEADDWSSKVGRGMGRPWRYANAEVDRLFILGRISQDNEQKKKIYQKIHRLIYQDQPACFLYFPFVFHAVSARFENTDAYFNVNMPNYVIKDFFIKDDADHHKKAFDSR